MNDVKLRSALMQRLTATPGLKSQSTVIEELGILHGSARIDVAVVTSLLHGYELKSDQDSLGRLPRQSEAFGAVFDRLTLVVGYRHAGKAILALPEWWGIITAESIGDESVKLREIRRPLPNHNVDVLSLARLLWKREALDLLEEFGHSEGMRSKPRSHVYTKLVAVCDRDTIRARVCRQLALRAIESAGETRQRDDD